MKMLIGLGNPGKKYQNNRHNVGQMFVDFIASSLHCSIVKKEKLFITMKQLNNETIILAKTQTFMNNSGLAVNKLIRNFKLEIRNLIIVHDDLDIPLGKFHIQVCVGPHLHNGLDSIEQHLKTKDFWRVRIGVDARTKDNWVNGETYVLQNFLPTEKDILDKVVFPKAFRSICTVFYPTSWLSGIKP